MEHFTRGGLTFDVRDEGPADGPCVVLLHGFPQDSTAWSQVMPGLVQAGCRVLAPDLRGYSPGARPEGRSAYRIEVLVGDVLALLDAAGVEKAHVVGHDWGGGLAWAVAATHPERVASLVVLSTPHPAAMMWATFHSTQALKSAYMAAFQVPALPELVLRRHLAGGGLERMGLPAEHARAYARRMLRPGALTGALGWYRALTARPAPGAQHGERGRVSAPVTVPTTYLWGRRDPYLGRAAALRTRRFCTGDYRFVTLDAGHWLPETRPNEVVNEILDLVRS